MWPFSRSADAAEHRCAHSSACTGAKPTVDDASSSLVKGEFEVCFGSSLQQLVVLSNQCVVQGNCSGALYDMYLLRAPC
jgi:hypothetical protein